MSNPPNIPVCDSHEEVHGLCVLLMKRGYVLGTKAEIDYDHFSYRYYVIDRTNNTVTECWDAFQAVRVYLNIEKELTLETDQPIVVKEHIMKTDYELKYKAYDERKKYYPLVYPHLERLYPDER